MLPFDYNAFEAVARVSVENPVLAVRADSPWKSLGEFLDEARAFRTLTQAADVHQNVKPKRKRACCRSKFRRSSRPGSSVDFPATCMLQPIAIQERLETAA